MGEEDEEEFVVYDPWRSMSVVRDVDQVVMVFGLAALAVAAYFNNWIVWPLYWMAAFNLEFCVLYRLYKDAIHGKEIRSHMILAVYM
jgi:omega-3 fatty acid desaturase (delta-15 desaturase)